MMDMLGRRGENKSKALRYLYAYRYDLFAIGLIVISILVYFDILWNPGQIVFSDIDFPFNATSYMNEIVGLWNNRWNTTAMLNIPRLFVILPSYLLSMIFEFKGSMFLKVFIIQLIFTSAMSTYLLSKRLVSIYSNRSFDLPKIFSLIFGSLFYALNPYVIFRIQHIYLLVGYSLFPLIILYFFKLFDHKFQHQIIKGYSPYSGKIYSENVRDAFVLAYLLTIASAAIHYFFYSVMALAIIYALLILKYSINHRGRDRKKILGNMIKKLIVFGGVFIGFSFFWLSIYIGSILVGASATQHNINVIDTFTMFSRNSSFKEVLFLISYWWRMIPDETFNLSFYLSGTSLIVIMLFGLMYKGLKHHIILLVSILGALMLFLATGVNYPGITQVFLFMCNLPFFGNVFRDPNKLIGLLALSYSVLIIFGLEGFVEVFDGKRFGKSLISLLFTITAFSLLFYIWPMKTAFVNHYYEPVKEPKAYEELRSYSKDSDTYSLYLPIAEQMLRPIYNIATPRWNIARDKSTNKATGDVHIYNAPTKTLFHHEGNDPMVTYYINWLQWLLDQGRSLYIGEYINAFGVNQLIYHDEYLDHESRQVFNRTLLDMQKDLKKNYQNDIFSVYEVVEEKEAGPKSIIWSPGGLYKLEMYQRINEFNMLQEPTVFMNQKNYDVVRYLDSDDYMDVQISQEAILTMLSSDYKVYPFEWVKELNPFLKWSKTYLKNPDWAWYMQQLGVVNKRFDMDQEHGVVVTFATGKLDILPHLRKNYSGQLVMDFETLLRTDSFFESETPSIYEVQANPIKDLNSVGVVNGVLSKGDPKDIWQVAKSKLIRAKENTPYAYNILISGQDTNKLHVKVRFFDKTRDEIGVQYVTSPNEQVDFEAVNFLGEAVSPKGTEYMRIDLLAFQQPKSKTYWWIHDINIYDYSAYKAKNAIEGTHKIAKDDYYDIYMRCFMSPNSGEIKLDVNETSYLIQSQNPLAGFKWIYVGKQWINQGQTTLTIENIEGFNSINQLALIPSLDKELLLPIQKTLRKSKQLIALEGEVDFIIDGNLQTRNLQPSLSYGSGLSLSNGKGSATIEIIESNFYDLDVAMRFPFIDRGQVIMEIINSDGKKIVSKAIVADPESYISTKESVQFTPLSNDYLYKFIDHKERLYYDSTSLNEGIYLEKGFYEIRISVNSQAKNLSPVKTIDKFDPSELVVSDIFATPYDISCSPCESISEDMFRHSFYGDTIRIEYDPTCSCDWYIYSSPKIDVTPLEELRVSFQARSENIRLRHGKLVFIDDYDHVLDTAFIYEIEESEKDKWHTYEQLVNVPEGANQVLLQFWARGNKEFTGQLELKALEFERYNDYITLDYMILKEQKNQEKDSYSEIIVNKVQRDDFKIVDKTLMGFKVKKSSDEELLWNSFLSPSPLWRNNTQQYDLALNGITMGYQLDQKESQFQVVLGRIYYLGILMHMVTFIVGIVLMIRFLYKGAL